MCDPLTHHWDSNIGAFIPRDLSLDELIRPVATQLEAYHWLVSTPTGPFAGEWICGDEAQRTVAKYRIRLAQRENDTTVYRFDEQSQKVSVESIASVRENGEVWPFAPTDTTAWKPGFVPVLSRHVVVDEQSFFVATRCTPLEISSRAIFYDQEFGILSAEFFAELDRTDDLFIGYGAGWWEVFSTNCSLVQKLLSRLDDAVATTWKGMRFRHWTDGPHP